ncbi:MAG TPA: HlyD family efflux transporter periplasmic adaptor subunit [Stellaceae bacterium]|nr:HlyD family efflux transporter periplasmic adaptor subunit [Stellaceae bacterium]
MITKLNPAPAPTPPPALAQWEALSSVAAPGEFYRTWLALQCSLITGTASGLLLVRQTEVRGYAPAAKWPEGVSDLGALARVAQQAQTQRRSVVVRGRLDQASAQQQASGILVAHPVGPADAEPIAIVAIAVAPRGGNLDPQAIARQLHWGAGWLETLVARQRLEEGTRRLAHAAAGLDLLALAGEHRRLDASLIAIANELSARLQCERVSIGLVTRRRDGVRLKAMSHAASFQRKSQEAGTIENAMEEALDQRETVVYPAIATRVARIAVAHKGLAKEIGDRAAVVSLIMPSRGRPLGVITLERHRDAPFDEDTLLLCEAIAAVIGPMIDFQETGNRWITGRLAEGIEEWGKKLVGPRHPLMKLAVAGVLAFGLIAAFVKGDHTISAKTVIEGVVQRAVVAPFDGFIQKAPHRAGDAVHEGEVLATLEDKDLVLDRLKSMSEREKLVQKHREALATHERAQMVELQAEIHEAEAQLALVEEKLARTRLVAPIEGIVVSGDLSQMLGSPVEKGKTLFEVAPLEAYRIVVEVDERDLRYVEVGQKGRLAVAGLPSHPLDFSVEKITPVSEAREGRNYFRVEGTVEGEKSPLRPGMEGVAKIVTGRASLGWIWSHSLIDWLRLALWKWMP